MFLSVFRHFENPKPTSQQERKTNKRKQNPCRYFRTVFDNQNVRYQ
jgi:hypothetical protein